MNVTRYMNMKPWTAIFNNVETPPFREFISKLGGHRFQERDWELTGRKWREVEKNE
jgi:hypothetical protein